MCPVVGFDILTLSCRSFVPEGSVCGVGSKIALHCGVVSFAICLKGWVDSSWFSVISVVLIVFLLFLVLFLLLLFELEVV